MPAIFLVRDDGTLKGKGVTPRLRTAAGTAHDRNAVQRPRHQLHRHERVVARKRRLQVRSQLRREPEPWVEVRMAQDDDDPVALLPARLQPLLHQRHPIPCLWSSGKTASGRGPARHRPGLGDDRQVAEEDVADDPARLLGDRREGQTLPLPTKCRKRSPKPVKTPAPWYCPNCLSQQVTAKLPRPHRDSRG